MAQAAFAVASMVVLGASSAAFGQNSFSIPMAVTTINSASWTLKGMNSTTFSTPLVETLGSTTGLNPIGGAQTDVRTLNSSVNPQYVGSGTMKFEGWHWDNPSLNFDRDFIGFGWSSSNTGFWIEAVFNVTFSQSVTFNTGNTGYTDHPFVSVNGGSNLSAGQVLAAGTYTFTWDFNRLSNTTANSGQAFGLYFTGNGASAVPGSGLAAVGSLGLAGLARRRRR